MSLTQNKHQWDIGTSNETLTYFICCHEGTTRFLGKGSTTSGYSVVCSKIIKRVTFDDLFHFLIGGKTRTHSVQSYSNAFYLVSAVEVSAGSLRVGVPARAHPIMDDLQEILEDTGVTEEEISKKVVDKDLEKISTVEFRELCSHLEMTDSDRHDAECEATSESGKRTAFFKKWKKRKGSRATYKKLIIAHLENQDREGAEQIAELLKNNLATADKTHSAGLELNEGPSGRPIHIILCILMAGTLYCALVHYILQCAHQFAKHRSSCKGLVDSYRKEGMRYTCNVESQYLQKMCSCSCIHVACPVAH